MKNVTCDTQKPLTWWQMIASTFAASLGVQNEENHKRDFSQGEIRKFIVVAVGFTLVLLCSLIGIVQLVVS